MTPRIDQALWSFPDFTYDVSPETWEGMMSDQKYRQRGYMENDRGRERPTQKPKPQEREGPRSPRMMAFQEKVRCAACAATLKPGIAFDSHCAKCGATLHQPPHVVGIQIELF